MSTSRSPVPSIQLRQFAWDCLVDLHRKHVTGAAERHPRGGLDAGPVERIGLEALAAADVSRQQFQPPRAARSCATACRPRWRLSPSDRDVLVMRNLEQMPAVEIAALLGVKEGTVRVRHLRALERLRALLDLEEERRRKGG